ncbi:hypothetical protein ACWGBO_34435 [[Kitasatospora] papulosa]
MTTPRIGRHGRPIGHLRIYVFFPATDLVIQNAGEFHLSVARIYPRRSSELPFPSPVEFTPADLREQAEAISTGRPYVLRVRVL